MTLRRSRIRRAGRLFRSSRTSRIPKSLDPFESIGLFETVRSSTLSLLRRVDPALHANYGMHAERGKESIEHLIRLYAGHDLNHLAQIEGLVNARARSGA